MIGSRALMGASSLALAAALALGASPAAAQDDATEVETVVVTGSLIAGTPEDAALPVQVIGQDDIQKQGSPSTVELIKALPSSSGVIGDANQFGAGRTEGSATINLRTLGAARTLVLMNGRRIARSAAAGPVDFVDLNIIPPAAIGRIEVLKDGAAATYGSDAIGGVVNIITRKNFNGLEVGGDYSFIDGSNGDYTLRAVGGWSNDRVDVLLATGYQHRSQLRATERDFVTPKFSTPTEAVGAYLYNPNGGWSSASNPGTFLSGATAAAVLDPGCPGIGGVVQINATQCLWRYADFDNLVEHMNLWEAYGEVNIDLTDNVKAHFEVLYANAQIDGVVQSVTYGPNQYPGIAGVGATQAPTAPFSLPYFFIPATNPGLVALKAVSPAFAATGPGVYAHPFFWRPMATGGNPYFGGGGQEGVRENDSWRAVAELSGKFDVMNGVNWNLSATYSSSEADQTTPDFLVGRLELALRGLGGDGCNPTTGTPGAGSCKYFNPFSNSVAANAITGQPNPGFVAGLANDPALIGWIYGPEPQHTMQKNELWVVEGVLNGESSFNLGGGAVSWALGAQYRKSSYEFTAATFTDNIQTPCVDTIINGTTSCAIRNGPYTFYGNYAPVDLKSDVWAVFGELNLPITDTFSAVLAVRHEDLGDTGTTTNPKIALRWEVMPGIVLRGSAGTTFRAPPLNTLTTNAVTVLAFTPQTSSYKPYDTFGNPNLDAEKADTYNVGAVVNFGGFTASVDYWRFDFKNPLGAESGLNMVNALFPIGQPNHCGDAAYAALIARFTFNSSGCGVANFVRVHVDSINAAPVKTSGIDFSADYTADDVMGGRLRVGMDGTYTLEYKVGAQVVEGITTVGAFDAVGKLNYLLSVNSLPQWKGSAWVEYTRGRHNLRWVVRYIDDMKDQRSNLFTASQSGLGIVAHGAKVDSWVTHEVHYRAMLPWDTTLTASVVNIFDNDPPFARLDYSYDPFTANPLGRVYKLGITKKF